MNLKKKRFIDVMYTALEPPTPFQDLVDGSSSGRNGLFEGDIVGVLNQETPADAGISGIVSDLLPVQFTDAFLYYFVFCYIRFLVEQCRP
jgi:hypothetical protein